MLNGKKVLFSGMQATGNLTLGTGRTLVHRGSLYYNENTEKNIWKGVYLSWDL